MNNYSAIPWRFTVFLIKFAIVFGKFNPVQAHQGHNPQQIQVPHHEGTESEKQEIKEPKIEKTSSEYINEEYIKEIKPIFHKSCFDCHSKNTVYPWYFAIPGIRQLINDDISKAMGHIDMTNDFPFEGHGTPKEDLEAIQLAISDESMPPLRYRVMHKNSRLNQIEREEIKRWIENSQVRINGSM